MGCVWLSLPLMLCLTRQVRGAANLLVGRPCPVNWQPETAVPAIQQAKTEADAVIVFIHWGFEYENRPDPGAGQTSRKRCERQGRIWCWATIPIPCSRLWRMQTG